MGSRERGARYGIATASTVPVHRFLWWISWGFPQKSPFVSALTRLGDRLRDLVEGADSDVSVQIVRSHDRLEVFHREQKAIDGMAPADCVAVVGQRRDVAPRLGENTAHRKRTQGRSPPFLPFRMTRRTCHWCQSCKASTPDSRLRPPTDSQPRSCRLSWRRRPSLSRLRPPWWRSGLRAHT
jgi:hypothetical protein